MDPDEEYFDSDDDCVLCAECGQPIRSYDYADDNVGAIDTEHGGLLVHLVCPVVEE